MNRKKWIFASGAVLALGAAVPLLSATAAAPVDPVAPVTAAANMSPMHSTASTTVLPPAADAAIAALFGEPDAVGETRALLVLRDGQPIFERYGQGYNADSKLISWSMAKSVTAVLTGLLISDGRLALDAPAPVPAWQRIGDPRGDITIRHLLHMSAGLEHVETGDPVWESDTVEMLFGAAAGDMAGFAEAKPPVARPGEQYVYSSATSVILSDILTRTLTDSDNPRARRDAMLEFMRGRLIEPLGMDSLTPEFDANGTMIGGSIMHATARDYAKFGEFLRNRGVVDGQRLLPEKWMDFMLTPSPTDGGYGGHIWLNRPRPRGADQALWPTRGPNDLFACLGHQGQFIIVSPSQRLTIVRLGVSTRDQIAQTRERLADLAAAL